MQAVLVPEVLGWVLTALQGLFWPVSLWQALLVTAYRVVALHCRAGESLRGDVVHRHVQIVRRG